LVKKDEKRGRTNFLPQCFSQWCQVHLARSWKWPARVWTPAKAKYKKYREKKRKTPVNKISNQSMRRP
jgi:hypothetical protein